VLVNLQPRGVVALQKLRQHDQEPEAKPPGNSLLAAAGRRGELGLGEEVRAGAVEVGGEALPLPEGVVVDDGGEDEGCHDALRGGGGRVGR